MKERGSDAAEVASREEKTTNLDVSDQTVDSLIAGNKGKVQLVSRRRIWKTRLTFSASETGIVPSNPSSGTHLKGNKPSSVLCSLEPKESVPDSLLLNGNGFEPTSDGDSGNGSSVVWTSEKEGGTAKR